MPSHYLNQCWNAANSKGTNSSEILREIQTFSFIENVCKTAAILSWPQCVNTLRPRQNGRHFPDDIFKWIFFNENVWISIDSSLKFVPKGQINNIPALVQIMAWRRSGDKPLSEPMMVSLMTHICVTRPQWVNTRASSSADTVCWYLPHYDVILCSKKTDFFSKFSKTLE